MEQLTKEQAITLYQSNVWREWSDNKLVWVQLNQDKVCVGWSEFSAAIERVLGRGVYSHEFGLNKDGLIAEFKGLASAPSFDDIVNLIPSEKRVIVQP